MIIDAHGHVSAPPALYAYKSGLLAARGAHGYNTPTFPDEMLSNAVQNHLSLLKEVGTDMQLISPRPFQMMSSERPVGIVHSWARAQNDVIAAHQRLFPDVFAGVCGLPQAYGQPVTDTFEEMDRCLDDLGMVGVMLNPDPAEGTGYVPPMGDEYWYPLYEKLQTMDVPALIHTAGCRNERESYSNHFITEEGIAILSVIDRKVFDSFPNLKLIISHAGGPIPFQIGRWRAQYIGGMAGPRGHTDAFDDQLRKFYFDTCVYNVEALDLEFKICGPDRCLFGTEKPGTGSAKDPKTGVWLDDTRPVIESISWLTEQDKRNIFEENCRKLYTRLKVPSRA